MVDLEIPVSWPRYPFLPLKRLLPPPQDVEIGVLFHPGFTSPLPPVLATTVFLVNLGAIGPTYPQGPRQFMAECPKIEYPSLEALEAAGWVVD